MSTLPQTPLSDEDYGVIEGAVMETARGRWFLAEYARRNRNADTASVLDAVGRLEAAIRDGRAGGHAERIRFDLIDMANAIARTKAEIAAIHPEGDPGRIGTATSELDAIVKWTETATGDILAAAEHLQEVAWTLREAGVQGAACDIIDQRATDIYTACSFQDLTGQRTRKVIGVLQYLEDRLDAMMRIWGLDGGTYAPPPPLPGSENPLLNGPALPGEGLEQSDIDAMLAPGDPGRDFAAVPAAVTAEKPPAPAPLPPPLPLDAGEAVPVFAASAPPPEAPARAGADGSPFTPPVRPKPRARSEAAAEPPAAEPAVLAPGAAPAATPFTVRVPARPEPAAKPEPAAPAPAVASMPVRPVREAPPARRDGAITLADIEALPFEERAALFS